MHERSRIHILPRILLTAAILGTVLALTLILPGCLKNGGIKGEGLSLAVGSENVYYSPASLASDGEGGVYSADATARELLHYGVDGKVVARYTSDEPIRKVLYRDGSVYALAGDKNGKLLILSDKLKLKSTISVGHTPVDLVIDGGSAYIANRFDGSISIVNLSSDSVQTVAVGREPMALALADGKLFVGCFLPEQTLDQDVVAAKIAVLDTKTGEVTGNLILPDGSTGLHGLCASADGTTIYCTHILSRYGFPTTQLDRGWVNTNALSVIDADKGSSYTILLDGVDNGAANPWDAALSPDGAKLYVSIAGTGELEIIDLAALTKAALKIASGSDKRYASLDELCNNVAFLQSSGALTRLSLGVKGLRDLEATADGLFAACYFDGKIMKLSADGSLLGELLPGEQPENDTVRAGEILWYDGASCYQGWESCSSCHPEGRCDGLNWDEAGDGYGTAKNTKSMIYSHRTPPSLATGMAGPAENNVYESMRGVYCNGTLTAEQISCADDYLRSLKPVESPYLTAEGGYSEAALRGKALFESAGCAFCHPAPYYTDLKAHKSLYVGSDGTTEDREIYTPTLMEIWRSAPYTFTGRVASVADVIRTFAPSLAENEVTDLAEFVLSIGQVNEPYGVVEVFGNDASGEPLYNTLSANGYLTEVTIQKQKADAPDAYVTATYCAADGSEQASATGILKELPDGGIAALPLGWQLGSPEEGAYLVITITDAAGKEIAPPLKLVYSAEN